MASIPSINNEAVMLLITGEHDRALSSLRYALNSLKSKLAKAEEEESESAQCTIDLARSLHPGSITRIPLARENAKANKSKEAASPQNLFCFYSRAFQINDNVLDLPQNEQFLSKILLFNMAITCHEQGMFSTTSPSSLLMKALSLYKMVLYLAEVPNEFGGETYQMYLDILLMAVFSNMGHIYSHFYLQSEAATCRKQLEAVIAGNASPQGVLDKDEYAVFCLNSGMSSPDINGTTVLQEARAPAA